MQKLTHSGTDGRTYGGDPNLIHIPDHHRADFGRAIADTVISTMRLLGTLGVGHDAEPYDGDKPVCPGCYMIGLFDALVELAKRDGQSVQELGASMAGLFTELAKNCEYRPTEEMIVISADTSGPSCMTDTTESTPLQELIRELGLHMDATFTPRSQTDNAKTTRLHEMQIHWRVRIYRDMRSAEITTSYSLDIEHLPKRVKPPTSGVSVDEYNATVATLETGKYSAGGMYADVKLPPPSITDVLYTLVSDAETIDYGSFEGWAAEFGYDTDSRKAESVYRACLDIGLKLRRMLSDAELTKLREAFQDY